MTAREFNSTTFDLTNFLSRVVEFDLGEPLFRLNVALGGRKLALRIDLPMRIEKDNKDVFIVKNLPLSVTAALKLVKTFSGFRNFTAQEMIEEESEILKWISSIDKLRPLLNETIFTIRRLQLQFNFVLFILHLSFFLIISLKLIIHFSLV